MRVNTMQLRKTFEKIEEGIEMDAYDRPLDLSKSKKAFDIAYGLTFEDFEKAQYILNWSKNDANCLSLESKGYIISDYYDEERSDSANKLLALTDVWERLVDDIHFQTVRRAA